MVLFHFISHLRLLGRRNGAFSKQSVSVHFAAQRAVIWNPMRGHHDNGKMGAPRSARRVRVITQPNRGQPRPSNTGEPKGEANMTLMDQV